MWIRQWYYLAGNYSPISLDRRVRVKFIFFFPLDIRTTTQSVHTFHTAWRFYHLGKKAYSEFLLFGQIYSKGLGY